METVTTIANRLITHGKFRHIQILIRLAELGSVQRTSEAVGLTQSGVTQTLAYIEKLAGTRLFHRHARGITPTAACKVLLPVARNLMQGIQDSAEALHTQRQGDLRNVRLIASSSATNGLLLRLLPLFHAEHPTIQVQLREAESDEQLLAIARKEVDIVACRQPSSIPEGWSFTPLFEDRLLVVAGSGHPLAKRSRLQWKDLAQEVWVLSPAGADVRKRHDELAAAHGLQLVSYPLITRSIVWLHALLTQNKLLALLPRSFVQPQIEDGDFKILPLSTDLPLAPLGLMTPTNDAGQATLDLSEFLKRKYQRSPKTRN
jgi:DNA-binding transcriptional LysR family regulator